MASIRWHVDENVPRAIPEGLRRRGYDVTTTQDLGMVGASDEQHLDFASTVSRVIFTQDTDFLRMTHTHQHAGIVYAPQGTSIGDIIRGLMLIGEVYTAEEMIDRVEFV